MGAQSFGDHSIEIIEKRAKYAKTVHGKHRRQQFEFRVAELKTLQKIADIDGASDGGMQRLKPWTNDFIQRRIAVVGTQFRGVSAGAGSPRD